MLANEFPGSVHIREVGLRGVDDQQIWDYGRARDFVIVSKDTDFRERSLVEGFPPKVIWLGCRNRRDLDDRRAVAARAPTC